MNDNGKESLSVSLERCCPYLMQANNLLTLEELYCSLLDLHYLLRTQRAYQRHRRTKSGLPSIVESNKRETNSSQMSAPADPLHQVERFFISQAGHALNHLMFQHNYLKTGTPREWATFPTYYRMALNLAYGVSSDDQHEVGKWVDSLIGYYKWDRPWVEAQRKIENGVKEYMKPLHEMREGMDGTSKAQFDIYVDGQIKPMLQMRWDLMGLADLAMGIRKYLGLSELP
jgi:hypothetical protein